MALISLRTGHYLYSDENLQKCQHFTPEEAKSEVLKRILNNPAGWPSGSAAMTAARAAQIRFIDHEIVNGHDNWLIPYTRPDTEQVKRYFAMLDCGTLITEFASEPEEQRQ